MKDGWKIHKYGKTLEWRLKGIREHKLCSETNAKYLLEFQDYLFAEGLSIPRVAKYLRLLCGIDKRISHKDLKQVDKKDVIQLLTNLEQSNYSEWTKSDYKIGLKKFYKWMNNGILPEHVSWVKSIIKNKKRMLPQEILSPEEIINMIEEAGSERNKALIGCLYESGCRIGELMTLKLKHISFDKYGVIFMVNGKTGVRRVRIISSSNLIGRWLNTHPDKKNQNSYLWCRLKQANEMLGYASFIKLLRKTAKKAEVSKRVNPHSFRHARATHMANKLTEAQMKEYFGWVQGSNMASIYVHLSGRDVDKAVLNYYGIDKVEEKPDAMQPITCNCGEINTPTNNYCNKCGKPLKTEVAVDIDNQKDKAKNKLNKLMKNPEFVEFMQKMVMKE